MNQRIRDRAPIYLDDEFRREMFDLFPNDPRVAEYLDAGSIGIGQLLSTTLMRCSYLPPFDELRRAMQGLHVIRSSEFRGGTGQAQQALKSIEDVLNEQYNLRRIEPRVRALSERYIVAERKQQESAYY